MHPTRDPRRRLEDGLSWTALLLPVVLIGWQWMPVDAPDPEPAPEPTALAQPTRIPPRIYIDPDGFRVVHPALQRPVHLPCNQGDCVRSGFDHTGLSTVLRHLKERDPSEEHIELVPHPDLPYTVLERTMRTSRRGGLGPGVLFPAMVVLGDAD